MKPKIYIDGREGTTGLQIYERLGGRDDLELLLIDEDKRKDTEERRRFLNAADIVFLCLPDAAARDAVSLIENETTRVIDASTAHRTEPDWDYGFAELSKAHRAAIAASKRVANPGCHASGFISSVYPLVAREVVPADFAFTCSSLTGYSGGGKKMIAEYEDENRDPRHASERIYGLNLQHGGNHVVWFGLTWNYELYTQANKRIHRQGQTEKVIIHHLVCTGTRDEDVMEALHRKDDVQNWVMESLKARIRRYKGT